MLLSCNIYSSSDHPGEGTVLKRTVVGDWRFDNLSRSHLQSQVNSVCLAWSVETGEFSHDGIGWNSRVNFVIICNTYSVAWLHKLVLWTMLWDGFSVGQYKEFSVSWKFQTVSASMLTFTGLKRERCVGSAKEIYLRDNKQRWTTEESTRGHQCTKQEACRRKNRIWRKGEKLWRVYFHSYTDW